MLTYLDVLEKDSTCVGTALTNASSLSSGSGSRQQSANMTMEQQYQAELLNILQTMMSKMEKLDKNIDEKRATATTIVIIDRAVAKVQTTLPST